MWKIIVTCLLGLTLTTVHAAPQWHWRDSFTAQEATGLKRWIEKTEAGMTRLFGPLPFDYQVHFHRSRGAAEPVPWANTNKQHGRSVEFHVDTAWSWDAFRRDWTAPHELSHLLFPFLGDDGRWFAEGIASYLEYQILYSSNTRTWSWVMDKLQERFNHARGQTIAGNPSISELARNVETNGAYIRLYWGGAAYFLRVDMLLYEEKGVRLTELIREYIHCCYRNHYTPVSEMISIMDHLSGSTIFSETYTATVVQSGFPETADALDWLQQHPPTLRN